MFDPSGIASSGTASYLYLYVSLQVNWTTWNKIIDTWYYCWTKTFMHCFFNPPVVLGNGIWTWSCLWIIYLVTSDSKQRSGITMANLVTGDTKQRTGIVELKSWLLHRTCWKSVVAHHLETWQTKLQLLQIVCMQFFLSRNWTV